MLFNTHFEVSGRVQGVFFRKCTKEKAEELELRGWVRNTSKGTVEGVVQGEKEKVNEMKGWLSRVGSPHSSISKCVFSDERDVQSPEYSNFAIRKTT
uniref:Acylphosphatase n=1 Tax=Ixodes ricinus TaxID=34613 RepID=A0A0K8RJF8_IXORI